MDLYILGIPCEAVRAMIPPSTLQHLYTYGSRHNAAEGMGFSLKNRLKDLALDRLVKVQIGPLELGAEDLEVALGDGQWRRASEVAREGPEPFPLRQVAHLRAPGQRVDEGRHTIRVSVEVQGLGALAFQVEDHTTKGQPRPAAVPCCKEDNHSPAIIAARRSYVEGHAGVKLDHVSQYSFDPKGEFLIPLASKFAFLRFNFKTGDAAGQNMVGRATQAACDWILERQQGTIRRFYLESNLSTDKKASQVNVLHTRGKRVTAEAVTNREVLLEVMHAEPERLTYHWGVSHVGSLLSGAHNNGGHSPNALAAISSNEWVSSHERYGRNR